MSKGKINVSADNIFPIIKKFLYSDHEIFLRELISNAVDATQKLKTLSNLGEIKGELGDLTIQVIVDKKKNQLRVIDNGIGMTSDDVKKYINDLAFSGATEFVKKYEDSVDASTLIGNFGLGFYSSFMVSDTVEIKTRSWQAEEKDGAHWTCDGSPNYELKKTTIKARGTEVILNIDEDSKEFLEDYRIKELLKKYARFMSIPIQCGERDEQVNEAKEGEDAKYQTVKVPDIINENEPAWTKSPSELSDEEYKVFYKALYPHSFEEPLFHIHLNVDYPFDLTGILFFPKIKPNMDMQKSKIQLFQSQVFVTDNVEGIVPEFLTMLHGVIDSKDIPLNVSRSYLQADSSVKKIGGHITKKVADKLASMLKNDREDFEEKFKDISLIIDYGMVTDEKFFEKARKFTLVQSAVDSKSFTMDEYLEKIATLQTDKDGNKVILYASDAKAQHSYIKQAEKQGYDVITLDSPISGHWIQKIEQVEEKLKFARIDSDMLDKLIPKDGETTSKLSDKESESLKGMIESSVDDKSYTIRIEALDSDDAPIMVTMPEFMRRMKEMSASGGGGFMAMGDMPDAYDVVVNGNHPLAAKIIKAKDADRGALIGQAMDLALLQQGLLTGEKLTAFINKQVSGLV